MSENKAPAAQLNCAGAVRLSPPLTEGSRLPAALLCPPLTEAHPSPRWRTRICLRTRLGRWGRLLAIHEGPTDRVLCLAHQRQHRGPMKDAKIVVAKAIPHRRGEPRCIAGFATDMDIPEVSAGRTAEHAEMGLQGLPGWQERDEGPGCRPGRGNGRAHQLAMNTQGKLEIGRASCR